MSGLIVLAGAPEEERYLLSKRLDKRPYLTDFPHQTIHASHSAVETSSGLQIRSNRPSTGKSYLMQDLLSHTNFRADICFRSIINRLNNLNYYDFGFGMLDSISGYYQGIVKYDYCRYGVRWTVNHADYMRDRWVRQTFWSNDGLHAMGAVALYTYFRIVANGTNRMYYYSIDGQLFTEFIYTDLIDANFIPDQIGIFFSTGSCVDYDVISNVYHFEVTY